MMRRGKKALDLYEYVDNGMLTQNELYSMVLEHGGKTHQQIQKELGKQIGDHLAPYVTGFYLLYAYKKMLAGKDIYDVEVSARKRRDNALMESRVNERNEKFSAMARSLKEVN